MFCLRSAEAFLRSKSVLLAAVFASVSSIAFSQDSFMVHFTPSGGGAGVINRGDFNNDGIPDIITGNNGELEAMEFPSTSVSAMADSGIR
jgi:hypothetical protein